MKPEFLCERGGRYTRCSKCAACVRAEETVRRLLSRESSRELPWARAQVLQREMGMDATTAAKLIGRFDAGSPLFLHAGRPAQPPLVGPPLPPRTEAYLEAIRGVGACKDAGEHAAHVNAVLAAGGSK